jgi:tetratricopeptide (TPR) repeat protein
MCLNTGSLVIAERQAELAMAEAPKLPRVLLLMGRVRSAHQDYPAAIEFYRRSVELAPTHDALVALGVLYALTGRAEEAGRIYGRVIALHHSDGFAHTHGGVSHRHAPETGNIQLARFLADHDRNLDEALESAEAAANTFTNVFVMDTLAWCHYRKGDLARARETITKALRWNTPDATIHFHAGMIGAGLGDHAFARTHLYQALNLNPHFHPADANLAARTLKSLAAASVSRPPAAERAAAVTVRSTEAPRGCVAQP